MGHFVLFRPGLLMCDREESRLPEKFARVMAGVLDRLNRISISTVDVAKAMILNSLKESAEKTKTLEHAEILRIAKET